VRSYARRWQQRADRCFAGPTIKHSHDVKHKLVILVSALVEQLGAEVLKGCHQGGAVGLVVDQHIAEMFTSEAS
jgi:hypothetical protein